MIRVYSWPTPNGHKVHIMLYECELEHEIYPVDIPVAKVINIQKLKEKPFQDVIVEILADLRNLITEGSDEEFISKIVMFIDIDNFIDYYLFLNLINQ